MKSNYFIFLIIVCVLFALSAVSAVDGQEVLNAEDNCQLNIDPDNGTVYESFEEETNQNSQTNNLKGLKDESANFTHLNEEIINCEGTFNLSHSYTYENDAFESGIFEIDSLVINGNNHVIDGANSEFSFNFLPKTDPEDTYSKLAVNDLTFLNFHYNPLNLEGGDFTLNNVNFTNCSAERGSLILSENSINLTLNECNFYSNLANGYINAENSIIRIYNTRFSPLICSSSVIELNRGQLFIENSSFENSNSKHGSIINYKGDRFEIKNSKFKNSQASSTGGAIIAKYFPIYEYIDDESFIFLPSEDMIIENCTFSNISSSSNGGTVHIDLDSACEHIVKKLNITVCNFTDCSSKFGGAISILGGNLNIKKSLFKNNTVSFEGGCSLFILDKIKHCRV